MRRALTLTLLSLTLALPLTRPVWAGVNISCAGSAWHPELAVDASGQPTSGGTLVSPPGVGQLSLWGGAPGLVWTVYARQRTTAAGQWPPQVKLHVRRASYGTGSAATITDDCNGFRQLGPAEAPLFHGTGDVMGIGVQIMLTGVTPDVPMRDYASQIIFVVRP